ncbi:MAG: signal peptidase I [Ruminococcaceae bacterium]|nr:signal peptidase I [Oscillospiraceae bacterium]
MNNEPITNQDLQNETPKKERAGFLKSIFDYVEVLAISVLAVLLVFTFCFRTCRVDGNSMNKTLTHEERLVTTNLFYSPKQGDIIVFHLSNDYYSQPLVKRVIALGGQEVKINLTEGKVFVDGVLLEEDYAYVDGGKYSIRSDFQKKFMHTEEDGTVWFIATVPEGKVFVMGDNRNGSTDSRAYLVSFVDEDCILGKAIMRLSPFTVFK